MGEVVGRRNGGLKKLRSGCALILTAILVTAGGLGAFLAADVYGFSPLWVFAVLLSIIFFAAIGWDYREQFRTWRFTVFFAAWSLVHVAVALVTLATIGLPLYPIAAALELSVFYVSAYWLFGLEPPTPWRRQ